MIHSAPWSGEARVEARMLIEGQPRPDTFSAAVRLLLLTHPGGERARLRAHRAAREIELAKGQVGTRSPSR